MKKTTIQIIFLFLMLAILVSQNSFAITGKDSWRDIRASTDLFIQQPTFAGIFGANGLFNACTTDDEFRSLNPVKTCLDDNCTQYEVRSISMSRTYIKNSSVTAIYPTSFSLAVIEITGSENGELLFLKTYALKTCE